MARELLLSYMLLLLTSRLAAENSSAVSSTRRAAESLHLISRCRVMRRRYLLYFISSMRSGVFFLFFWVV